MLPVMEVGIGQPFHSLDIVAVGVAFELKKRTRPCLRVRVCVHVSMCVYMCVCM